MLTGVFETISRDDLGKFIEKKGGSNKTAISGKTNYLIIGNKLEDGREVQEGNKYKKAAKNSINIMNEFQLEEFIS